MPRSLSAPTNVAGLPADVVTKRTPASAMRSTTEGSRADDTRMLAPKGAPVPCISASCSRAASTPLVVAMRPMPPARDTAEARGAMAMYVIGAWRMG
jgi:hypothetical protein